MSNRIVGFVARSPQGPWRSIGDIAAIPHIDHAVTYNATVHTEYCTHGELVIGYNVNADSQSDVYADAALYRPRFMTVRRASLLGPASPAPRARGVQPGSRALPAVSGG
jgi:hypothetical protein